MIFSMSERPNVEIGTFGADAAVSDCSPFRDSSWLRSKSVPEVAPADPDAPNANGVGASDVEIGALELRISVASPNNQ